MECKTLKFLSTFFIVTLTLIFFIKANGQALEKKKIYIHKDFELVRSIKETYINYYNALELNDNDQQKKSNEHFIAIFDPNLKIPIDFPYIANTEVIGTTIDGFTVDTYANAIGAAFDGKESVIHIEGVELLQDSIYYGIKDEKDQIEWFVWVKKIFTYNEDNIEKKYESTCKLTISKKNISGGLYKIMNVEVLPFPKDADHDFIADNFDLCIRQLSNTNPVYLYINGCEAKDLVRVPSSRFAVSLSSGAISSLNNEFTDKDIIGGNALIKPGYFNKLGFIIDLNGIYTINSLLGLRFGCMYSRNSLDVKELGNSINTFLADNGANAKIKFNNTTRKIYIPYIDLRVGNFKKAKSILSLEGIFGMALPTTSSKNLTYQVTTSGENIPDGVTNEYSAFFQSSSFPVYGGRLNYEFSPMQDGLGRFFINANYLTGNYNFKNQEINSPIGNKIIFEGSVLQLWGVSVGFSYNLVIPKKWKEKERLNVAQSKSKS